MWDLMDHTFHKKGSLIFLGHGHDLSPPKSILDFSPWNLESIALFLIHKYPNISKCSSQHTRTPLAPESGFRIYSCRSGVAIVASKAWRHWNITRVISFVPNIMPSVELVRLPKFRWSSCKKLIGKYAAIHGYYGFLRFDSNQKPVGQRYVLFFICDDIVFMHITPEANTKMDGSENPQNACPILSEPSTVCFEPVLCAICGG